MKPRVFTASALLVSLMGVLALLWLLTGPATPVNADPAVLYVAPGGNCGGMTPCYATIQAAVDAASNGDTIKVAQGAYTSPAVQVVYVSKAITLTGGFTTTDWANSYPITRPSVIDAENVSGRQGVYIDGTGVATITLAGLTVQRGNNQTNSSGGGGIYILTGTVSLLESRVFSNASTSPGGYGGGVRIENGTVALNDNIMEGNQAEMAGGGVYVANGVVTLNGNTIQGNSANGYRGYHQGGGGGVYVQGGTVIMSANTISNNTGLYNGGGVQLSEGTATLSNNLIQGNTIFHGYGGGGVQVEGGSATLIGNIIQANLSPYCADLTCGGGGVSIYGAYATLIGNTIQNNVATHGGGVKIDHSATLIGNIIQGNSAITDFEGGYGGGVYMSSRGGVWERVLDSNTIISNTAVTEGGGIAIEGNTVTAQNDIIANNTSPWEGIYLSGGSLTVRHWTIANNGSYALRAAGGSATLSNTIVASHTIAAFWGNNITADHTLFFNSGTPCGGGASCTNSLTGDPKFINPAAMDYHIGPGSAAVDAGVDAGVYTDIDSEPRPMRSGFDIGADELPPDPVAGFADSAPNWAGRNTVFTNTSVVTGTASYLWAFGDGTFSTAISPTHTYTARGNYTVVLTATNNAGSSVAAGAVTIYGAAFTSSSPDWLGQTTAFTNTTITSGTTTYLWSFGDGVTSTLKNPTRAYTSPGVYTVVLTATNPAGSGVATGTVVIYSSPVVSFTTSSPDWMGQTTVFTNATTTTPPDDPTLAYSWAFGDAGTSNLKNPAHAYSPGIYTVALTATNAAGSRVATDTVTVYSVPTVTLTTSSPDWLGEISFFTATVTTTPLGDPSVGLTWNFHGAVQAGPNIISHTFSAPGIYTVIVTATNPAGQAVATDVVVIYGSPAAAFTTSSPDWLGQTTRFTNTTSGQQPISYLWSFGDGLTSTQANLTRTYSNPGVYTIVLTASNPAGSTVATDTVTIYGPPTANFIAHPTQGVRPLTVMFTDTTATIPPGDPTLTYLWDFDGETSALPNPMHTYTEAGSYTVTLTVSNAAASDTVTRANCVTVNPIPVQAGFTASPNSGIVPLVVTFTNTTVGDYAASLWNFGDGITSTLTSPTHTYTTAGAYTVTLTVSGPGGTDALPRTSYITVYAPVHADLLASPTSGIAPLTVVFTNTSNGDYTNSLWNFGDGVTSTLTSPTHTYTIPGVYTVTLTVSGPGGINVLPQTNYITVYTPVHADLLALPTSGIAPLTVVFTNTSSGDYTNSLWSFGDGVTSTLTSPTHIYMAAGTYTATLAVTGPGGSDSKFVLIEVKHGVFLPVVLRSN